MENHGTYVENHGKYVENWDSMMDLTGKLLFWWQELVFFWRLEWELISPTDNGNTPGDLWARPGKHKHHADAIAQYLGSEPHYWGPHIVTDLWVGGYNG